jgi:hypothetical protein
VEKPRHASTADVQLAVDQAAGEMYVYSESDGMIRRIIAATPTK